MDVFAKYVHSLYVFCVFSPSRSTFVRLRSEEHAIVVYFLNSLLIFILFSFACGFNGFP